MNTIKATEGLTYLFSNDQRIRLIHGVLKGLGVAPSRDDYPDLVQEGCLIFAQVYAAYPQPVTPANERQLMTYAYRQIRWRLLDQLRRGQHRVTLRQYSLDDDLAGGSQLADPQAGAAFVQLERKAFFAELRSQSSGTARKYLDLVLSGRFQNDAAIARHCGVSPQAVYQWRRQLVATGRRIRRANPDML
ncbi:helix-turn-helix domain-containing protein [Limosilactobacillus kribbianus]|uniref:helix-turn-helix domain-containing protein n=1 Tax=Limosilactobacillus kribbianus TaxID=2982695 RepID=UPI002264F5EE|nr:helix-turn-helix domain-containing protein [Limosilactobacillus kribbianus]